MTHARSLLPPTPALPLVLAWLVIGLAAFWVAYAPAALGDLQQSDAVNDGRPLLPGQTLPIKRKLCVAYDVTMLVHREFQDGLVFSLPDITTTLPKGCRDMNSEIILPHALPPGAYMYRVTLEYQANPLRRQMIRLPDVHFTLADAAGHVPEVAPHLNPDY